MVYVCRCTKRTESNLRPRSILSQAQSTLHSQFPFISFR